MPATTADDTRPLTDAQRDMVASVLPWCYRAAREHAARYGLGDAAEDVAHEAVLGAMKAARRFDPGRGVTFLTYAAWQVRSTIQRWHDRHERSRRVAGIPFEDMDLMPHPDRDDDDAPAGPTVADVEAALWVLTDRQRVCFVRRKLQGESLEAIAADLGCTPNNVRHVSDEAVKRMRRHFQRESVRRRLERRLDLAARRMTPLQLHVARRRHVEGATLVAIAAELNVSKWAVMKLVERVDRKMFGVAVEE